MFEILDDSAKYKYLVYVDACNYLNCSNSTKESYPTINLAVNEKLAGLDLFPPKFVSPLNPLSLHPINDTVNGITYHQIPEAIHQSSDKSVTVSIVVRKRATWIDYDHGTRKLKLDLTAFKASSIAINEIVEFVLTDSKGLTATYTLKIHIEAAVTFSVTKEEGTKIV